MEDGHRPTDRQRRDDGGRDDRQHPSAAGARDKPAHPRDRQPVREHTRTDRSWHMSGNEMTKDWIQLAPGVRRMTAAVGDKMMQVVVWFEKGAKVPEHAHV